MLDMQDKRPKGCRHDNDTDQAILSIVHSFTSPVSKRDNGYYIPVLRGVKKKRKKGQSPSEKTSAPRDEMRWAKK